MMFVERAGNRYSRRPAQLGVEQAEVTQLRDVTPPAAAEAEEDGFLTN